MKNQQINAILNRILTSNTMGKSSNILDRTFKNVMFISSVPDKASEAIKSYLTNEFGANVITVTPNGYEISKEKAGIDIDSGSVHPIIYPGDKMTDKLKQENTVLLLPNLDQMSDKAYRKLLLDMSTQHIVADYRNGESGFAVLDDSFFAIAIVGRMSGSDIFELATIDAKDSFILVDLDEITIDN